MLEARIIEPLTSEWAPTTVLVQKIDGRVRWCIDYPNSVTKTDVYPLPLKE